MIRLLPPREQEIILETLQDETDQRKKQADDAQSARKRLGCLSREEFCKRYA
jgi:hypothetical protein